MEQPAERVVINSKQMALEITKIKKPVPRITVHSTLTYEDHVNQPVSQSTANSVSIEGGEDCYGPRNIHLTEEWKKVDLGWLNDGCSAILVKNSTQIQTQRNPTIEEQAQRKVSRVQLSLSHSGISPQRVEQEIPYGLSLTLLPMPGIEVYLKTITPGTKAQVFATPQ